MSSSAITPQVLLAHARTQRHCHLLGAVLQLLGAVKRACAGLTGANNEIARLRAEAEILETISQVWQCLQSQVLNMHSYTPEMAAEAWPGAAFGTCSSCAGLFPRFQLAQHPSPAQASSWGQNRNRRMHWHGRARPSHPSVRLCPDCQWDDIGRADHEDDLEIAHLLRDEGMHAVQETGSKNRRRYKLCPYRTSRGWPDRVTGCTFSPPPPLAHYHRGGLFLFVNIILIIP